MLEILKTLQDTPLPSILVIGGIVFILLSYVEFKSNQGHIIIERKELVGFIGFILLCGGIGLYLIPAVQTPVVAVPTETLKFEVPSQIVQPTVTLIVEQPTLVQVVTETPIPTPQPTSTPIKFVGWVICWHGKDGYEYLIAYPENDVKQGISLNYRLTNAQGRELELANDSLKMCYVDGEWYGYPDPSPWFAGVSYMQLQDRKILVCSDSPGCQGNRHELFPEKYYPANSPNLQAPNGTGVHVITYKSTN
ncbi:MAG: hypothetical protein JNK81_16485 [Anaerolineales bacterium]|nr:hypothetical protein [Anaerolineales bacterium]